MEIIKSKKIGLWTATALVVGNMIASGIFLLPSTLGAFGGISVFGWVASSIGAITLALLFSNLSKRISNAGGGPYAYTRAGLGEFAAYMVAWSYWISICVTAAAITATFLSYLSVFFPILTTNSFLSVGTGLFVIWMLTGVNTLGVKSAGGVQLVTTILKLTPLVLVAVAGLFYIKLENFIPFNVSGVSDIEAITATATLTLFAFVGLESATIPSGDIEDPEKTIPRATMLGTGITILVYVLGSITVMGMIPASELKISNAPFADAAEIMWGEPGRYCVAAGAIVSTFGALNGWILLQGQIPRAAARDNLFPEVFKLENKKGMPATGIVLSSIIISALLFINFTKGLTDMFTFMVLLATVIILVPYLFSAATLGIIILQEKFWKRDLISKIIIASVAFIYSLWAVAGSGSEAVYWGFMGLCSGIPFYVWMKRIRQN